MKRLGITIGILLFGLILFAQTTPQDAMQAALQKLEQAQKDGDAKEEAAALCDVATADLMAGLDAEAEDYASRAEKIARSREYPEILSRALVIKSNLCAYAETDNTFNRNDEGIGYAREALAEAESSGLEKLVMESCFSLSQLYVNKNRWNKKLNAEWYALAGAYLDRAENLSKTTPPENKAKVLAFRMRYFRQGNEIAKAIEYCEKSFEKCEETDYLLKSQLCDQLTPLYIEAGQYAEAANAHSACVHFSTLRARASEADKLQEMQGKYEMELKQAQIDRKTYQILFLILLAVLLLAAVVFLVIRHSEEKKLRIEAQNENIAKEELIEYISKDLRNPLNTGRKEFETFAANASRMSEEQIAAETKKLLEEGRHLSRDVAEYVSEIIISKKKIASDFNLTDREIEIIKLSAEGLSATQIADRLFLSSRTVSNHKASIYSKMGVKSNGEMCRKAREAGII